MKVLTFNDNSIIKAAYIGKREELWIEFTEPIRPSYTCAVFVDVPVETAKRFKNARTAGNGDEFFQQHIRRKFKYYLSLFDLCEVWREKNWNKTADNIATYAEYEEMLAREMQEKYNAAMNAL